MVCDLAVPLVIAAEFFSNHGMYTGDYFPCVIEVSLWIDLEDLNIFIWMLSVSVFGIPLLNGPHKCSKLARDDPIHISILYPLIILVFLDIE